MKVLRVYWHLLCLLVGIIFVSTSPLQAQVEPDVHIQAILGRTGPDSALLAHVLRERLVRPYDKRFIADRDLLTPLCVSICTSDSVFIKDTLPDGTPFKLKWFTQTFQPEFHSYTYFPGKDSLIREIDGLPAFGAVDSFPARRTDSMVLLIDGQEVFIPREAYSIFYEVNLCHLEYWHQPLMVYPSLDGRFLYVYLYGGEGTGLYFAKMVFDRSTYLTYIASEYGELRRFGAIRPDFVGY